MFGMTAGSMLVMYLFNVMVVYVVLAGFMPQMLGANINYRGKGLRLMLISLGWLPLAIASMVWMIVRKNRQIDEMHEELETQTAQKETAPKKQ